MYVKLRQWALSLRKTSRPANFERPLCGYALRVRATAAWRMIGEKEGAGGEVSTRFFEMKVKLNKKACCLSFFTTVVNIVFLAHWYNCCGLTVICDGCPLLVNCIDKVELMKIQLEKCVSKFAHTKTSNNWLMISLEEQNKTKKLQRWSNKK